MDVESLYYRIIAVANHFLKNANALHLKIEALRDFDPSVSVVARNMRMLAAILKELASDSYNDENMAINAFQCCLIMEQIAAVVASGNEGELGGLIARLEQHVNVP